MKIHAPTAPEARSELARLLSRAEARSDDWKEITLELCAAHPEKLSLQVPHDPQTFVRFPHLLHASAQISEIALAVIISALRDKSYTPRDHPRATEKAIAVASRIIRGKSDFCDIESMWQAVLAWLKPKPAPPPVPTSSLLLSQLFLTA